MINFVGTLPVVRGLVRQFIWWAEPRQPAASQDDAAATAAPGDDEEGEGEEVEWVNMCWRKVRHLWLVLI